MGWHDKMRWSLDFSSDDMAKLWELIARSRSFVVSSLRTTAEP